MTAIRVAKIPNGYRFEYDLMQDVRDRLNRKIEVDGEKALEIALAEVGYVKERTCKVSEGKDEHKGWWVCSECGTAFDMIGALAIMNKKKPMYCPGCGAKAVG